MVRSFLNPLDFHKFAKQKSDFVLKDILLLTPPFTQLNTPYPATAYLKGFLNTQNIDSFQMDLGLEVILALFTKKNLEKLFQAVQDREIPLSDNATRMLLLKKDYLRSIEDVIAFLQGKNPSLARLICGEDFLPQASRFDQANDLEWAFGAMGFQDKAKHLATLYLEDLSDFITECIDENFGFSRYAERLGRSANHFDELQSQLEGSLTFIDEICLEKLDSSLKKHQPKLVGISVPFPGNLYSAFRCAQFIKKQYPKVKIVMGGGFPNTELRSLTDIRVFDSVDFITLDDGERPMERIHFGLLHPEIESTKLLKRTFQKVNNEVFFNDLSPESDYKQKDLGTPDYSDLLLHDYLSVIEVTNPMHSLWSDGRWNKLTMAHGCYWGKCTFCDGSLDYIKRFEPNTAKDLVDRMERMMKQTGENGFHFVDEAAPPALMVELALEILRRGLIISWWTNIRFEKSFTADVCQLFKKSGCIAVSGGLEVASDRLLKRINKGVTVEQVAQVADHFTASGILVHAYLMYGFPGQSIPETVDSLEMVRQLFEMGVIQSGFWHQFALTAHSPIGLNPSSYDIVSENKNTPFANNDLSFKDPTNIDHQTFSFGLRKSLLNFMNGIGFDLPLQSWFEFKVPKTGIQKDFIQHCLEKEEYIPTKPNAKIVWLGTMPVVSAISKTKKGQTKEMLQMTFHQKKDQFLIKMDKAHGEWLLSILNKLSIGEESPISFSELKADFESQQKDFDLLWYSKPFNKLREHGLLIL